MESHYNYNFIVEMITIYGTQVPKVYKWEFKGTSTDNYGGSYAEALKCYSEQIGQEASHAGVMSRYSSEITLIEESATAPAKVIKTLFIKAIKND